MWQNGHTYFTIVVVDVVGPVQGEVPPEELLLRSQDVPDLRGQLDPGAKQAGGEDQPHHGQSRLR